LFFDCSQKQALKKHIFEKHEEGKKPFKCDICDQSFSQKSNLKRHIVGIHERKKKCECLYATKKLRKHRSEVHEGRTV
jgi:uncharacterized Zn-finger protein